MENPSIALIPSAYKASKLYSALPNDGSGDFTHVRASVATRVNSDGLIEEVASGVPRIDYFDGVCPSLLLEPQSTNLFVRSESYQSIASNSIPSPTPLDNQFTSPDGSVTAWRFADSSTGAAQKNYTITSNTLDYLWSIFVKPIDSTGIVNTALLGFSGGTTFSGDIYTASTDTVNVNFERVDFPNGWIRIYRVFTNANNTTFVNRVETSAAAREKIQYWGNMLEQSSYITSYIETVASTVTRLGDVCKDAGATALFNSLEGVLYCELAALVDAIGTREISINDGTQLNTLFIQYNTISNRIQVQLLVGGGVTASMIYTVPDILAFNKIAFKYKLNDFALWVNGVERATDTSGAVFTGGTLNSLEFNRGTGSNPFYGKVKDLRVFKTALTDAELTTLTT